jgi:acetolactate synthase-1/2/3 large subunit
MPSADYTLIKSPYPDQKLVHVYPDPEELGRVYRPTVAVNATPAAFAAAFAATAPKATPVWANRTGELHQSYLEWSTPPASGPGAVHMGPIMAHLEEVLPEDAVICNGAGNFATWMHRYHRYRRFNTQAAPTSGSMGYGVPAGVAAKHLFPEREVIVWAGDGDFMMHGQEFATAVQYGLPIVVVILNNGIYGTIRMHQEREYPGRVSGTMLNNPDFAALARAYGGHGETVTETDAFAPAFARARAAGVPAIIDVRLDPEAITPTRTLSDIRNGR